MNQKSLVIAALTVCIFSCTNPGEKKAQEKLQLAKQALNAKDYSKAKLEIDSIKILYPQAFEARKEGIKLMQQVEYQEQVKTLAFLDSALQIKQQELKAIETDFLMEKDTAYQDIGIYIYPGQKLERNLNRSFLRAQVDERGTMYLTSIYSGSSNIHHQAIKVIAPDGTYAETPATTDIYESTNLGVKTEKADYKLGTDGNVIGFIALNNDKNLKVEYLGKRKYTTSISASDRKAITEVYQLARILIAIEEIRKETKEANLKLEFVKRKIEEGKPE